MPAFQRDPTVIANGYRQSVNPGGGEMAGVGVGGTAALNVAIDGTPSRVAGLLVGAGVGLALLKFAGFRFSVAN